MANNFDPTYKKLRQAGLKSTTSERELAWLYKNAAFVASRGFPVVELGTYYGLSAMIMGQAICDGGRDTPVITVDDGSLEEARYAGENISRFGYSDVVQFRLMDDLEYIESLDEESVGMVFVDSLHSYIHVSKLLAVIPRVVAQGGLISGHDYCPQEIGVVRAVEEWRNANPYIIGWGVEDRIWWTIKK